MLPATASKSVVSSGAVGGHLEAAYSVRCLNQVYRCIFHVSPTSTVVSLEKWGGTVCGWSSFQTLTSATSASSIGAKLSAHDGACVAIHLLHPALNVSSLLILTNNNFTRLSAFFGDSSW